MQTMICKTPHRKLKIEQQESQEKESWSQVPKIVDHVTLVNNAVVCHVWAKGLIVLTKREHIRDHLLRNG